MSVLTPEGSIRRKIPQGQHSPQPVKAGVMPWPAGDIVLRFLQSLQKQKAASRTRDAYERDIVRFLRYLRPEAHPPSGEILIGVKAEAIEGYIAQMNDHRMKLATIRRSIVTLRRLYAFLFAQNIVSADPTRGIRLIAAHGDALNPPDILRVMGYLADQRQKASPDVAFRYLRDELILCFMLFLGFRQNRILQFRLSEINIEESRVTIPLVGKETVELSGVTLQTLNKYISARTTNIFTLFTRGQTGEPLKLADLQALRTELRLACNVDCSPEALHHTYQFLQFHPDVMQHTLASLANLNPRDAHANE